MKIIKVKNYDKMSEEAFKVVLEVVKNKPDAVLGLATGLFLTTSRTTLNASSLILS